MIGKISIREQRILTKNKVRIDENARVIDAIVKSHLHRAPNGLRDRRTGIFVYKTV